MCSIIVLLPSVSTLFPYTTLFRSGRNRVGCSGLFFLGLHCRRSDDGRDREVLVRIGRSHAIGQSRSEEHTSELQSQSNLVCRLLLEKKKSNKDEAAEASRDAVAQT